MVLLFFYNPESRRNLKRKDFFPSQVDLSHIYGTTLETQHRLRLFRGGKLKYRILKGEVYPPLVSETGVRMIYPAHVPETLRFAVGQPVFGMVPGLMMYAVVWLREHNRVCEILSKIHPAWDDERLFQTARLILIGNDFAQPLGGEMVWRVPS